MKNGSEARGPEPPESAPAARRPQLLIVGAGGMLGTALLRVATGRGYAFRAYSEERLDITDRSAVQETLAAFAAEAANAAAGTDTGSRGVVVNAAAYTDVERAEDDAERAFLVNEVAAGWLAEAAHQNGLAFVHVSTDFVFDGTKGAPYVETDEPNPLSIYGASKLAGEQAVCSAHPDALVVRTAWTYGLGGINFPLKILQRARALVAEACDTPTLRVVADEIGSPTYSVDLADGLLGLLSAGARGVYHLAGGGSCSRYEQALETLRLAGLPVPDQVIVEPVASASFSTRAARPLACVLDCGKAAALGVRLPAWQSGLARFLAET